MSIISRILNYFENKRIIKSIRRLVKITISNQEIREIPIKSELFLMPGRYSLVYRDKFHNTQMKRFTITEPMDISIKEIFSLK
jgi:hypothetical protein